MANVIPTIDAKAIEILYSCLGSLHSGSRFELSNEVVDEFLNKYSKLVLDPDLRNEWDNTKGFKEQLTFWCFQIGNTATLEAVRRMKNSSKAFTQASPVTVTDMQNAITSVAQQSGTRFC